MPRRASHSAMFWPAPRLTEWLACWRPCCLSESLVGKLTDCSADWLTDPIMRSVEVLKRSHQHYRLLHGKTNSIWHMEIVSCTILSSDENTKHAFASTSFKMEQKSHKWNIALFRYICPMKWNWHPILVVGETEQANLCYCGYWEAAVV